MSHATEQAGTGAWRIGYLVAFSLGALVSLACLLWMRQESDRLEAGLPALLDDLARKVGQVVNREPLMEQHSEIEMISDAFERSLPSRFDRAASRLDTERLAAAHGLEILEFTQGEESQREFYVRMDASLSLRGKPADVYAFIEALAYREPIRLIPAFDLHRDESDPSMLAGQLAMTWIRADGAQDAVHGGTDRGADSGAPR